MKKIELGDIITIPFDKDKIALGNMTIRY